MYALCFLLCLVLYYTSPTCNVGKVITLLVYIIYTYTFPVMYNHTCMYQTKIQKCTYMRIMFSCSVYDAIPLHHNNLNMGRHMFFTYKCTPLLLRTHNVCNDATYSKIYISA